MTRALLELEQVIEGRVALLAERPITFIQFLEMVHPKEWTELIDGVVVEKPMVQLDHELLSGWLYSILRTYVEKRKLGIFLSSRILVEINPYGGRLPDLLFVREERKEIVQQKAVFGAPDLIIEIISPNDRAIELRALEADYCTLGVAEICFIELRKQTIRLLCKRENEYEEQVITSGPVTLETVPGITLQAEWILKEPRPHVYDTVTALLQLG